MAERFIEFAEQDEIVVIGDCHIKESYHDSETSCLSIDGYSVLYSAFLFTLDRVLEHYHTKTKSRKSKKIALVFLGDIFDRPTITPGLMTDVGGKMSLFLQSLKEIGLDVSVVILSGNHDDSVVGGYSAVQGLKSYLGDKAYIVDAMSGDETFDTVLPFLHKKPAETGLISQLPFVFSHNFHHPLFGDEVDVQSLTAVAIEAVYAGHYHDRSVVDYNGMRIYYVGSPFPINRAEKHKCALTILKKSGVPSEQWGNWKSDSIDTSDILAWGTVDCLDPNYIHNATELSSQYKMVMLQVVNCDNSDLVKKELAGLSNVFVYRATPSSFVPDEVGEDVVLDKVDHRLVVADVLAEYSLSEDQRKRVLSIIDSHLT